MIENMKDRILKMCNVQKQFRVLFHYWSITDYIIVLMLTNQF